MITKTLKKLFGTRNERILRRLWPEVQQINELEEGLQSLTGDQLRAKTDEFRQRLKQGETVDDLMHEAFAVVKNACRRLIGTPYEVTGHTSTWDMIPYDVQLIGAMALHRNSIAEMATGEGKTLVATMPLYLNALTERNCQLVTVNDYLARRDAEWMGLIYNFLGVTVGCIQNSMSPDERREQYGKDITYGTNSEFGFDYLRDMGMAKSADEMVQRDYYYVIIDEIDSILIDEARTPLIISGPASVSTHRYHELKPAVSDLFRRQSLLCNRLANEAKETLAKESPTEEERYDACLKLFKVRLGMPKHKQLMRLLEDPAVRKQLEKIEAEVRSDSNRGYLQEVKEDLYFTIDERGGESDLSEMGRQQLSPQDPDAFVLPDLADTFSQIDADDSLAEEEKAEKRRQAQEQSDIRNEKIHNISQLIRAYCLFEKDVQYVVKDDKVMIVDEFTGRLMPGRRFSEGLHQALEAKEGVTIERETQTLASITIQNYFRMYEKLAGMTGTAETEAQEFKDIYDLDVLVIPTNRPVRREDADDRIFKTKREKYRAIVEEVAECHERRQPVLLGTVSVDVSEVLSRMLERQRVPHSVLNAKNHQYEAEIVARAGQPGSVTIATNMAGRGTDIKLGEGVTELGGLHVLGSARHDSRRIDRQLRGRCARQGDPGSSRFYVSLEDNLMRLFGSDRVSGIMEKLGMEEGEELSHPWLNKSIQRAQRRVEQQHFSFRKQTLQYDDVMNKQREVVYGLRREILTCDDPRGMLFDFVHTAVSEHVESAIAQPTEDNAVDLKPLHAWLVNTFPLRFREDMLQIDPEGDGEKLTQYIVNEVDRVYALKEKTEDAEALRWAERQVMLNAIDRLYQEHLYSMDSLRQGVQLRAYGQKDPLVEYKQEAYYQFSSLMDDIKQEIVDNMFRSMAALAAVRERLTRSSMQQIHQQAPQLDGAEGTGEDAPEQGGGGPPQPVTVRRAQPKVGRNAPCPCGSGKKFKHCCGR